MTHNLIEIKTNLDLPQYGQYVLVYGVDQKQYGLSNWHVCQMNDLEDGMEFQETGKFFWLTENGALIENVTHWSELPKIKQIGQ
jgi:hypothetical protein